MSNLKQLIDCYPRLLHGSGPRIPGYIRAGWYPIVMRLMAGIDALLGDELAAGFRVLQMKEKFGGLRFYFELSSRKDFTVDFIGVGRLRLPDEDEDSRPPAPGRTRPHQRSDPGGRGGGLAHLRGLRGCGGIENGRVAGDAVRALRPHQGCWR